MVLLLSIFSAAMSGPLSKIQEHNGLVPWSIPYDNDNSLGPAKEAIKVCYELDFTPGTIHSAKNISKIL
uniref:Secreted protein n=1 Tax=Bursaphelenchus xylophilus TaxID=6326 RepID=A0A1I7SG98_BURXY